MRPRKPVLLYCARLPRLSIAAYVLEIRCTWARITVVHSIKDAEALAVKQFDCIVLLDGKGVEKLIRSFDAARVILVPQREFRESQAGRQILESDIAGLIDAMRVVAKHKRGPKSRVEQYQQEAA